jgi:Spy/CpxP family protein refolding chaperone
MYHVDHLKMVEGEGAVMEYGPEAKNGLVIIVPKPGVAIASGILGPCPYGAGQQEGDPFTARLFPPSWVMSHQQAIGLTDEQKSFIQQRMKLAQQTMVETDAKLRGEMESLDNLLAAKQVDEAKVLETVDRVLAFERDMKRAQVSLMISVKNKLTEDQQAQLDKLRGD